jgi:hypothetical protein
MTIGRTSSIESSMRDTLSPYPGQFDQSPDPLFVAIPGEEIAREMERRGEEAALSDVCMAVAVVAEALHSVWMVRDS